jgi:hypothetical protein
MPFEYEALVGHMYVVGGRSISASPPGALVEVAPRKAGRGREADTFFALVLPSGDALAPASFYEQMAQKAAEQYFDSSGSVTAGLREIFNTLNVKLVQHNESGRRPYEANLLCAVLRGHDLFVGRIGPCLAMLHHKGKTQFFPEEYTNEDVLFTAPMGVHPVPDVKMTQYRVQTGTRVIFGDVNLAEFESDKLRQAMKTDDLSMALVNFRELARLQMTLMAVEFVPPDIPTPETVPTGSSTTEISARARGTGTHPRAETGSETGAAEDTSAPRPRKPGAGDEVRRRAKYGVGRLALMLAAVLRVLSQLLDRIFGLTPDGNKRWLSTPVGTGVALLLPVVVAMLVIFLGISRAGESEFELCMRETESRAELARGFATVERQTVMRAWQTTLDKIAECNTLRPGDPGLVELRREAQGVMDVLNRLERREALPVAVLPGTTLSRILVQGQILYVLDSNASQVYAVTLSSDGLSSTQRQPIRDMRRGGTASGFPIGEIVDIAYNGDDNVLVAIDRDGLLIECTPRFLQCTGQRLLGAENWSNPTSLTTWASRLYILDSGVGQGQIWRYDREGGSYGATPREYFTNIRPPLNSAIDLAIDGSGYIYTLLADGNIQRWFQGEPQTFHFADFPDGQELTSVVSMFLDNRVTSQSILITAQQRRTVYETSRSGTFLGSYSVFEEELFDSLADVVAAPGQGGQELIYAVSGNTIFVIEK